MGKVNRGVNRSKKKKKKGGGDSSIAQEQEKRRQQSAADKAGRQRQQPAGGKGGRKGGAAGGAAGATGTGAGSGSGSGGGGPRKECWFHQHGGCKKGSQCDMAHVGAVEVNMALFKDAMDRAVDARIEEWLRAAEGAPGEPQMVLNCVKHKPPVTVMTLTLTVQLTLVSRVDWQVLILALAFGGPGHLSCRVTAGCKCW